MVATVDGGRRVVGRESKLFGGEGVQGRSEFRKGRRATRQCVLGAGRKTLSLKCVEAEHSKTTVTRTG